MKEGLGYRTKEDIKNPDLRRMTGQEIVSSLRARLSLLKEYHPDDLAEINIVKRSVSLQEKVIRDQKERGKYWDESTGHFHLSERKELVWFYRFGVWEGHIAQMHKTGMVAKGFASGKTAEELLRKLMPR